MSVQFERKVLVNLRATDTVLWGKPVLNSLFSLFSCPSAQIIELSRQFWCRRRTYVWPIIALSEFNDFATMHFIGARSKRHPSDGPSHFLQKWFPSLSRGWHCPRGVLLARWSSANSLWQGGWRRAHSVKDCLPKWDFFSSTLARRYRYTHSVAHWLQSEFEECFRRMTRISFMIYRHTGFFPVPLTQYYSAFRAELYIRLRRWLENAHGNAPKFIYLWVKCFEINKKVLFLRH